jgi:3D (Asp-Asp-Asp) domain-containing protein
VNRVFRRIRSKVQAREFAVLAAVTLFSVLTGYGAQAWYAEAARESAHDMSLRAGRGAGLPAAGGQAVASAALALNGRLLPPAYIAAYAASPENGQQGLRGGAFAAGAYGALDYAGQPRAYGEGDQKTIIDLDTQEGSPAAADAVAAGAGAGASEAEADAAYGNLLDLRNTGTEKAADLIYTVKVLADGELREYQAYEMKLSELFAAQGIVLSELDRLVGGYLDGTINSHLYIEVVRVTQETKSEEKFIPAKTVYRDNANMLRGATKVVRNAVEGKKRLHYLITYENGVQAEKLVVKEEVLVEPISKIIEQGTSGMHEGNGGPTFKYSKVIDVKCTAYTSSYEDTGKRPGDPGFGITATGLKARKGVVAVDPSVIPLGSEIYIDFLDESVADYGYAIAGDTGGKIKGKKVDLYFDADRATLLEFGVKKAKVYILD